LSDLALLAAELQFLKIGKNLFISVSVQYFTKFLNSFSSFPPRFVSPFPFFIFYSVNYLRIDFILFNKVSTIGLKGPIRIFTAPKYLWSLNPSCLSKASTHAIFPTSIRSSIFLFDFQTGGICPPIQDSSYAGSFNEVPRLNSLITTCWSNNFLNCWEIDPELLFFFL